MTRIPSRLSIANLPTRIEKLDRLSQELGGPAIYIKRDDQTGMEFSGNKVRKLEYTVREALDQGCNYLITCGGIQSNHCRATAAVAARLGLKSGLLLRGNSDSLPEGNLFLDKMLGADIVFTTPENYSLRRQELMLEMKKLKEKEGYKPYIIPEGASNGIGAFGYYTALEEIALQEQELGINFDAIVIAVGSGGTYAGLLLAKKLLNHPAALYGINVGADKTFFENCIEAIFHESTAYLGKSIPLNKSEINIIDGYVGRGYGLSTEEELKFISHLSCVEGLILDNVYTGKAMYGLVNEIKKGKFNHFRNVLFIHTGGMFELFSQMRFFNFL
jgi:D-cysteine desulfhydrase